MKKQKTNPAIPGAAPWRLPVILLAALALGGLLAGCEINEPEMPTFDTSLTIPLGVERVDILDAVEDEDYLIIDDEGGLSFSIDGDPDTLSFDFDLSADIASQTIEEGLGDFNLDAVAPISYAFELGDIWAPANGVSGMPAIVPGFPIDVLSGPQSVPDIDSAVLTSGEVTIEMQNGLPVPVGADSGPDQIILTLENPADGVPFATLTFPEIPGGGSASRTADLAGVTLPGSVQVRLSGGSPGSSGALVTVNGTDSIEVDASFSTLVVSSATALVGAQTFHTTFSTELPADYELEHAVISDGSVDLQLSNDMPVPCQAVITWDALMNLGGHPLSRTFDLDAGETINQTIDFGGYVLTSGGVPLTELQADVDITTPGSGGASVTLTADAGLTAHLQGGTIAFSSVTGIVPEYSVAIDPIIEEIDLPEEMDGLELVAATMTLRVTNGAGLPADLDLMLTGTSAAGNTVNMAVSERILAAQDRATTTDIVLDQNNSQIVDFLNNLPVSINLSGDVNVGGDGTSGTVHQDDFAVVTWDIAAPVEIIITGTTLDTDPSALDLDEDMRDMINDRALGGMVQTEILNHLPMGVEIMIKAHTDTNSLASAPLLEIGPITVDPALVDPFTHIVSMPVTSYPVVELTAEEARIFSLAGLHTMVEARLPSSEGQAVRVLSTDYLEVRGVIQMDVHVDDQW